MDEFYIIRFIDDDDRAGARGMDDGKVAFEAPHVQVRAGSSDDEDGGDVCRNHLIGSLLSGYARVKTVFLGRISTMVVAPASGWWSGTTAKCPPTAGNRPRLRNEPDIPARTDPPSTKTS